MNSLDNHNLPNKEKVKLNLRSAFWELMVSSSLSFILHLFWVWFEFWFGFGFGFLFL